jgi:hypothetical protein
MEITKFFWAQFDHSTSLTTPATLRYWLANAASGDTINFNLPYPATITLDCVDNGPLTINTKNWTIGGPGAANLAIGGNYTGPASTANAGQVFPVNSLRQPSLA